MAQIDNLQLIPGSTTQHVYTVQPNSSQLKLIPNSITQVQKVSNQPQSNNQENSFQQGFDKLTKPIPYTANGGFNNIGTQFEDLGKGILSLASPVVHPEQTLNTIEALPALSLGSTTYRNPDINNYINSSRQTLKNVIAPFEKQPNEKNYLGKMGGQITELAPQVAPIFLGDEAGDLAEDIAKKPIQSTIQTVGKGIVKGKPIMPALAGLGGTIIGHSLGGFPGAEAGGMTGLFGEYALGRAFARPLENLGEGMQSAGDIPDWLKARINNPTLAGEKIFDRSNPAEVRYMKEYTDQKNNILSDPNISDKLRNSKLAKLKRDYITNPSAVKWTNRLNDYNNVVGGATNIGSRLIPLLNVANLQKNYNPENQ